MTSCEDSPLFMEGNPIPYGGHFLFYIKTAIFYGDLLLDFLRLNSGRNFPSICILINFYDSSTLGSKSFVTFFITRVVIQYHLRY